MELKRKYFICWIDNSKNVDSLVKGLQKNLTEFWFMELDWQINPQSYEKSFKLFGTYVEALEFLKTKSVDHAIIIKIGHDLESPDGQFIQKLDQDILDDDIIIGDHELYYLNVNQWKSRKYPQLSKIKERREFSLQVKKTINYINDSSEAYNFIKLNSRQNFLPFNTEVHGHHSVKDLSVYYSVACGLNHLKILKDVGYKKNMELIFFDYNPYSLYMMKQIHEKWDGLNYKDFIDSVDILDASSKVKEGEFEKYVEYFGGMQSWLSWFKKFKDDVIIYYMECDLLDSNFDVRDFDKLYRAHSDQPRKGNKLIWLSNIFHYRPTALNMGFNYRSIRQIGLLNKLNDIDDLHVGRGGIPTMQPGHWLEKDNFLIKEFYET